MNAISGHADVPSTKCLIAPITAAPEPVLADSLLNFVARAMADPTVEVGKLEVLLRMQREIVADDARVRFKRAMSACQAEIRPVVRDAQNTQTNSRYATLEAIDAAISPIYTRHGFSLEFDSEPADGNGVAIVCEVSHEAGHSKFRRLTAPLDTAGPQGKANKTPLHGLGSTVSYLRRYLTCMAFNVTLKNEDNDGNRSGDSNRIAGANDTGGRITPAQAEELWGLMARGPFGEGDVIRKVAPGLRSITQLPAADFGRVRNALLTKLSVLEQRAQAQRAAAARQPVISKMLDSWDANKNGAPA